MGRKVATICLVYILLGTAFSMSHAEFKPSIETELSNVKISIGDPFELRVKAETSADQRIQFPGDELDLSPFQIIERRIEIPDSKDGKTFEILILTLSIYEIGDFEIPSMTIKWQHPQGEVGFISTEPQFVRVESVLNEQEQQPRSFRGPLTTEPRTFYKIRTIAAGLAVLLLIVGLIVLLKRFMRKKVKEAIEAPIPKRPADIVALEKIQILKESQLLSQGNIRQYFIDLSEILKEYSGRRYAFQAQEHTTGEIRRDLAALSIDKMIRTDILAVLELSDMVKFARHTPPDEQCRTALEQVEKVIMNSRETPVDSFETLPDIQLGESK